MALAGDGLYRPPAPPEDAIEALRKRVLKQEGLVDPMAPVAPAPLVGPTLPTADFAPTMPLPPMGTTPTRGAQGGGSTYDRAPAGFDDTKWMNPAHQTPKYAVSRIIGKYGHSPEGLRAALPEIQALFPGTTIQGTDRLNFGANAYDGAPLGIIDVIADAGGTNRAFWNVEGAGGPAAATAQTAVQMAQQMFAPPRSTTPSAIRMPEEALTWFKEWVQKNSPRTAMESDVKNEIRRRLQADLEGAI